MIGKIEIGKISGASGIRGEVKLFHFSGERERIAGIKELYLRIGESEMRFAATIVRYSGKTPILRLEGITDRNAAERLTGAQVFVSPGELTPLERDCYYINDLIGLRVVDEHDAELGMIREIIDNPAHDILVVQAEEGVIRLIPLVDAFVRCIDLSACLAVVADLPDGM